MGSILIQDDKIVGYYSKKYNAQELNYTTIEKEFLAILKSLIHFKHLIFNTKTIIETDNKNLTFDGNLTKRVQRWKLLIEEFDYELKHIDGSKNSDADVLSRYVLAVIPKNDTHDFLINLDRKLIREELKENGTRKMLCLNTKNQHDTYEFIKKLHTELLHPGIHVFEQTIKPYFKIRHYRSIIRKICKECLECQREKDYKVSKRVPHYEFQPKDKNNTVGLDIKGPIKLSN
ncbi:Transposon Tf2-6 polyprotein [Dictyocoela muelleri]|nr:Transposon Tf2-6 polyprotein [Dictyocoela muelleri]